MNIYTGLADHYYGNLEFGEKSLRNNYLLFLQILRQEFESVKIEKDGACYTIFFEGLQMVAIHNNYSSVKINFIGTGWAVFSKKYERSSSKCRNTFGFDAIVLGNIVNSEDYSTRYKKNKIKVIKQLRNSFGFSLAEAKTYAEYAYVFQSMKTVESFYE